MNKLRLVTMIIVSLLVIGLLTGPQTGGGAIAKGSPSVSIALLQTEGSVTLQVDTPSGSNEADYQVCSDAPADCSLRGAISRTNADHSQTYTIELPAGTYKLALNGERE